jgi:hypothetical protein
LDLIKEKMMRRFQTMLALCTLLTLVPTFSQAQQDYKPFTAHKDTAYLARFKQARDRVQRRFTPAQRARIAQELARNAARGAQEARQRASVTAQRGTAAAAQQETRQIRLARRLTRGYDTQLRARYQLRYEDVVAINREAIDTSLRRDRRL